MPYDRSGRPTLEAIQRSVDLLSLRVIELINPVITLFYLLALPDKRRRKCLGEARRESLGQILGGLATLHAGEILFVIWMILDIRLTESLNFDHFVT
jgi:uncharacterized membrane protein